MTTTELRDNSLSEMLVLPVEFVPPLIEFLNTEFAPLPDMRVVMMAPAEVINHAAVPAEDGVA